MSRKIRSFLYKHFRHCRASTMSGLHRLHCLLMVIPAEENGRSLETDEAMMGRQSHAIDVHVWPYVPECSLFFRE